MKKINQKTWTEYEKYQLWLAYRLNVPLKDMSKWFNKSITSINKALHRYGIRPLERKRRLQKQYLNFTCTGLSHYRNILNSCELILPEKVDCLNHYEPHNKDLQPQFNATSVQKLKQLGITFR